MKTLLLGLAYVAALVLRRFLRSKPVIVTGDVAAFALVRHGALDPHEAPTAVLRALIAARRPS